MLAGEKLYTLDYYLKLAEEIVNTGAHVLAIKDMAGLLRPESASKLVMALRKEFDLPVHVHTHDTAGGQLATYYAAALWRGSSTVLPHRWLAPLRSLRCPPSSRRSPTPRATPASICRPSPISSLTGRLSASSTVRLRRAFLARPAVSTATRFQAASCPTCVRRLPRLAWRTVSRSSRTPMPLSMRCLAVRPR